MVEPITVSAIGFLGTNSIIYFQKKLIDLSNDNIKMTKEYRKLYLEHYGVILLAENIQNFIKSQKFVYLSKFII